MPETPEVVRTIQLLLAPVVMISAGGLWGLALYNRLAGGVSRIRAFNKERFDVLTQLTTLKGPDADVLRVQYQSRADVLARQSAMVLRRTRWTRGAIVGLLLSMFFMLCCTAFLGASLLANPNLSGHAFITFVLGVAAMMVSVVFALLDVTHALDPVMLEEAALNEHARQ